MRKRTLATLLTVLAAVAATMVTSAGPAAAANALGSVGAAGVTFEVCSGGHCVVGELETTKYPTGFGTDVVEFTCKVVSTATAASTTVDTCSVGGVSAPLLPLSAPGSAVAIVGFGTFPSQSTAEACIGGSATYIESIVGPGNLGSGGPVCKDILVINV